VADKTISIDLNAPAHLNDVPAMARAFFRWWGGELAALLPKSMLATKTPRAHTRLITINGVWRVVSSAAHAKAFDVDTSLPDHVLAGQIMRHGADHELSRIEVLLPREQALFRRIEMPVMPEADVRSAVELQIDRLTPFTPATVRFAYKIADRDRHEGKMTVDVVIVPTTRIQPIEERLHALGIKPLLIDVEGAEGGRAGYDLREPPSAEARRRARIFNLALALGAAVVWLLALNAWSNAGESERAGWQARIAELRPAAERTASIRRRVEALTQPIAVANAHDPARTLKVLDVLTHVLPDDTRVLDFQLDGTRVLIEGLSSNAPDLIGKLEAAPLFKDAKFASPVVRRSEAAQDRFEIVMQIAGITP
jgi:general secretion pathway protein L